MIGTKDKDEVRNERIGLISTLVVHALFILVAIYFVSCWKAPGPPWPASSIGLEVDFGTSDFGSGDVKSDSDPSTETTEQSDESAESPRSDADAAPTPNPQQTTQTTSTSTTQTTTQAVQTHNTDGPNMASQQTQSSSGPKSTTDGKDTKSSTAAANNNGDTKKTGDQGNPNSVNNSAIYSGNPGGGGGGGVKLSIAGWDWDGAPSFKDVKNTGEVKLSIRVNEDGEIENITVISTGLPPADVQKIKNKLYALHLKQISNGLPPQYTTGEVVIKVIGH